MNKNLIIKYKIIIISSLRGNFTMFNHVNFILYFLPLRAILIFITVITAANAQSPFKETTQEDIFLEDEIISNNQIIDKNINLNAIQESFWTDTNNKNNIILINFNLEDGITYKIRTRSAMTSTIIFKDDRIAQIITANDKAFDIKELGNNKFNLNNVIVIKPLMVGVDTSLTVIGESGNIYNFYLFSTDYKNTKNPHILTYIRNDSKANIEKINIRNLEKEKEEILNEEIKKLSIAKNKGEFLVIGDDTNQIEVNLKNIKRGYTQKPKKNFLTTSKASVALMALDIFNDEKYTYFKYDRSNANSKFPVIYRVVDGFDNPVNIKVVGDYIIAETISSSWTLRIGDEYVCVRKEND